MTETSYLLVGAGTKPSVSYCTPAGLTATILLKWLLCWEHPRTHTVWLAKALPREWLQEGEIVRVDGAATAWGRVSMVLTSSITSASTVRANITVPSSWVAGHPPEGGLLLRLRTPAKREIESVMVGQTVWSDVNASSECVVFTAQQLQQQGMPARLQDIEVKYK